MAELLARYGDPSAGERRHRRRAPETVDETASHPNVSRLGSAHGGFDRSAHGGHRRAIEPDQAPLPPAPYPPRPRESELRRPVGLGRRAAPDPWFDATDDQDTRFDLPVIGDEDPFTATVEPVPHVEPGTIPQFDPPVREPVSLHPPVREPDPLHPPVREPVPMPVRDRLRNRSHGQPPAGLAPRPGAPAAPATLRRAPAPPVEDDRGVDVRDDLADTGVHGAAVEPERVDAPRAQPVDDPYATMYGSDDGIEDLGEYATEEERSPVREWALVGGQVGLGVVGGAVLWLVCEWLWQSIPVVALVVALLVITGLVWVVRYVRRTEDLQTTVIAVLVGLFVTVSPAALLLVGR
ncbi:MAG: hypothetical protein ACR2FQ_00940 [Pseudonocardiaceae bacterium]